MITIELDYFNNINSVSWDLIVSTHLIIKLINGILNWNGSELLEHILLSNMGLILKINTKVLRVDFSWVEELLDLENLSWGFFNLILSSHNLPELWLCESWVLGNDLDDSNLRLWVALWRRDSSVNIELSSSMGNWLACEFSDHGL